MSGAENASRLTMSPSPNFAQKLVDLFTALPLGALLTFLRVEGYPIFSVDDFG